MQIPRRNKVAHRYFVLLLFLPPSLPFGILALDKFLPDSRESRGGKDLSTTGLRLAGIITIITTIDNGLHRERESSTLEKVGRVNIRDEWQQDGIEGAVRKGAYNFPRLFPPLPNSSSQWKYYYIYIYILFRRSPLQLLFSSPPPSLLSFSPSLSADLFPFFVPSLIEASRTLDYGFRARIQRALLCRNLETRETIGSEARRRKK